MSTQSISDFIYEDCDRSCIDVNMLRKLSNQTILITGGTGFVGKWIAEMVLFLNKYHQFNIKLYLLARDIEKFKSEAPHIAKNGQINLLEQDVRNLSELPSDTNFVVHAAGTPDSRQHASQPLRTIDTFLKGTTAVFEACYRLPALAKIIHVSSNYVYGNVFKNQNTINEKDLGVRECNSILASYSEAKRITETLCAIYRNQQQLPITIVRPFAFVGPYQKLDKPWAINNFIRDALLGGPIRILGDENTTRSYLYGSDMAFWLLAILANNSTGDVINIGSDESICLLDLAKLITHFFNRNIEILSRASKDSAHQIPSLVPDISVARKLYLTPTYPLSEAIERTIKWNQLFNNVFN